MRTSTLLNLIGVYIGAAQETCYMPIDVVFVQDTTGSFDDDLPNVVRQIPSMTQQILAQNPASYFAVTEFKDKPYYPLGESDDFCYKLSGGLTPDISAFQEAYGYLYASGGGDLPESSFQALINAATDVNVGWRSLSRPPQTNSAGARLMILSTDAVPHLPGDIDRMYGDYDTVPHDLPDFDFFSTPDQQCRSQDYPAQGQLKKVLLENNIYLAILTPNDPAIVPAWQWLNEDLLQQPAAFYQFISADSSDIIDGVLAAIKAVTETACAQTLRPTTAGPTTTTSTTATTTTTTTTASPTTTTTTTPVPTTTTTTTTPTTVATKPTTVPTTTTTTTTSLTTTPAPTTTTTTTTTPTTVATTPTTVPTTTTQTTTTTTSLTTTPAPTTTTTTTTIPTTVATTPTTVPATPTTTTTTTTASTLSTPRTTASTIMPDTTSDSAVSPVGSVECPPCSTPPCLPCNPHCPHPCAPGRVDPCCWDLVIKISDRPENVHIEMGTPEVE